MISAHFLIFAHKIKSAPTETDDHARKMKANYATQRAQGFTLIELMVTIGIIGIMTFVAIPSLTDTLNRMAVNAAARAINT